MKSLTRSNEAVFCSHIPWVENEVSNNGNTSAVRISFFGVDKADHFGIGDLLTVVLSNVIVADDLEGVVAFDKFPCVSGVGTNTLTDATKFVVV